MKLSKSLLSTFTSSLKKVFARGVGARDIAVFCRQFSVLLNAGVTIIESISILRGQTENKRLDEVLGDIHDQLRRGTVLSDAMSSRADVFQEFFINMVKVGEASGSIDNIMERLADYYERDNKIAQKVRSAMTYPVILAILTVAVIVLLMVEILPMFTDILGQMGETMPFITEVLMNVSSFFVDNLLLIAFSVVVLIVFFQRVRNSERGRFLLDGLILRLPGVRHLIIKMITARFARSMSILLKSGMPIIGAVDIMKHMIGNRLVERRFEDCSASIKEGRGIAGPVAEINIFPNLLVHMIAVGESSGELDEMLSRTAGFFDLEVEEAIDRLTVMIEPLMIIVLGVIVGVIIVSIMLPMISIMTSM